MKTSASLLALLFSLFLFCLPAHAADPFVRFVEDTRSFSADFTLQTEGANGKRTLSVGRLDVQKPGKFRWQIEQPAPQLMVCDGTTLWFYDQDLNQASRRPAREALPGTPA
ncbi:MAG: outer membrane lipoprotein carrier protein LolA, partial [Zoogloeaceae bacterium]|nr:outer membrane lipoprotein carrier protein LolA [Zoogloeaceae bacterium]